MQDSRFVDYSIFKALPGKLTNLQSVGLVRFELTTPRLSSVCSNQLSYRPMSPALPRLIISLCVGPSKLNSKSIETIVRERLTSVSRARPKTCSEDSRKEVIQPQVPLRLPCYDFTPVTIHSLGTSLLAVDLATSGANDSHGVTGGVYKARERIHPYLLIRDY